jgi:patatin-like phospholipase/acyl hydrolase
MQTAIKTIFILLINTLLLTSCTAREEINYNRSLKPQEYSLGLCPLARQDTVPNHKKTPFRILTIDGGGVRGIIPARILEEFEQRSGKPISELFDLMVGSSAGGLIVLALNAPNEVGQPKFKASDLVAFYKHRSKNIFSTSIFKKLYNGFGLWGPKYNRDELDKILGELFGSVKMSQLIKPTGVTSYNLDSGLPHLWSREYAHQKPYRDFFVKDIAAATSAAPTYFAPKALTDLNNCTEYQADGGIFVNNPASIAIHMAFELNSKLSREDIVLISLGTGRTPPGENSRFLRSAGIIGWVIKANLIDIIMNAQSEWYDSEIGETYFNSCRIQLGVDKKISTLDDTTEANLNSLIKLADDYINTNSNIIDHILKILLKCSD